MDADPLGLAGNLLNATGLSDLVGLPTARRARGEAVKLQVARCCQ